MPDVMTTSTAAEALGYSQAMVIYLSNLGILPYVRIRDARIFTPDDVRLFRRRVRAVRKACKTLKEWRDVEAATEEK